METKGKYKVGKKGRKALDDPRTESLTVRGAPSDLERLKRVRKLISPHVNVSQGKALWAALELAERVLLKDISVKSLASVSKLIEEYE